MKQAKKIFTRMCLNNWGGINHKILEFHEYVNLFCGKSGSGKSTVMDAIQVVLYGSFSPSFLNKAAALLFPGSQLVSMFMYVCMPLLAVTLCYQAARVLRRYRPDIWKTLNGGR